MPLPHKQRLLELEDPLARLGQLTEVVGALSERGAR